MKLIDILTSPWAIGPEKLREIQSLYATLLRGEKIDVDAIEARLGRPLSNEQQDYVLRDGGVAVLPIEGVLAPKANMFTRISGGSSAQMLNTQVESAIADPRVKALVLAIDSPGGSVFGGPELAATVRELSKVKPIVTVSDAMLASMAYWIGAAANRVFISGPTVHAGSIGVVATHEYNPRALAGAQITEITAGRYKRIVSDNKPLDEEGKAYIQARVDHLYSVFVDAVADYRGTTAAMVLERMADGRTFVGQQAIDNGLVDGFATVDAVVEQLATDPQRYSARRRAEFAKPAASAAAVVPSTEASAASEDPPATAPKGTLMDRTTLEKEHPQLFAALRDEFTTAGAAAERARIQAVEQAVLPGHEALIASLKFDGKTSGGDAALAVNAAERNVRDAQAKALAKDAPAPAKPAATPAVEPAKQPAAADKSLPVEDRCKAAWAEDAAVRAEFTTLAAYTAFMKANEGGSVRVLGAKRAA